MKVLIIRFSSIGDIVLTTPVVRCLHHQLGAEIHFLTKSSFGNILASNPYISKIWTLKDSLKELNQNLKKEKFDYIIDLHKNVRSLKIRRYLGIKSYSFDKLNIEKWLMVNFKWNLLPDTHIVHRYMESVKPLGVKYDEEGLDFFIPLETQEKIKQDLPFLSENDFVALVIGAAHETKSMTEEFILSFCDNTNFNIALIGGPNEAEKGQRIMEKSQNPNIYNLAGDLSIN
ncbi:MAG: glycosyltransferase family 9 protein, partial [Saprospiraceae bacterium]